MAQSGVGGHAGERIRAAALHADHEFRGRHGLTAAAVQAFQMGFRHGHQAVGHRAEADQAFILHAHDVAATGLADQPVGLQLLATQADHHQLAAEIRMAREVLQGADGDRRIPRIDGHAAAIGVVQRHHVIDIGVFREQIPLDAADDHIERAGDALHGDADAEDVLRANRPVGVAVALEGIALQLRAGRGGRVAISSSSSAGAAGVRTRLSSIQLPAGMSCRAVPITSP